MEFLVFNRFTGDGFIAEFIQKDDAYNINFYTVSFEGFYNKGEYFFRIFGEFLPNDISATGEFLITSEEVLELVKKNYQTLNSRMLFDDLMARALGDDEARTPVEAHHVIKNLLAGYIFPAEVN